MMCLDVLICTIDAGIRRIPDVLLPPAEGVSWVVSMQYTDKKFLDEIPAELQTRPDVTLTLLEGKGLSANRNNAIAHSQGDIMLIADDDCRYTADSLREIIHFFEMNPSYDIVCFAAADYEGNSLKTYPSQLTSFVKAFHDGFYPASVEIAMRRGLGLFFDTRFGLGSQYLCAGEEDVLIKDALTAGYNVVVNPMTIVRTDRNTTGQIFLGNKQMQLTKGAVFNYLFGTAEALWRSVKEAGFYLVHHHANPFPILYNMLRGIWILR